MVKMIFNMFIDSILIYVSLPLLVYYIYVQLTKRKYNLPPGPKGWPIIGSVPDPYSSPWSYKRLMKDWRQKYGDIILFKRFGMDFVYVNDFKMGFQAFAQTYSKELAGRPLNGVDRLSVGNENVFFTRSLDATWTELRKHVMIMLRKVAEPKKMTTISNRAYDLFATHIREKKTLVSDDGFYVEPLSYWVGHNLLVQVFWQDAIEFEDADYQDSIRVTSDLMASVGDLWLFDITPLNIIPHPKKQKIVSLSKHLSSKIQNHINRRRRDGTYKSDPNYFIDHCMIIQDNQKKMEERFSNLPQLTDWYIVNLALDIYFAGLDAFGIGFTWTIGLLATNPHVQDKIRLELKQMSDETGEIFNETWMDRLHYLNAVINEVMRIHSLSTFTSFHRAMVDVKIDQYDIPKDTIIALNIYGAHHDPKYWKNPQEFMPERFLNENGHFQLPKEGFMPFGVGRRICIAERYTVKESHFIFTGRLCQDFHIKWSSKNKTNIVEEDLENTFFRHTAPFYVEFLPIVK